MPQEYKIYHKHRAGDKTITKYRMKQHTKPEITNALQPGLSGDNLLTA